MLASAEVANPRETSAAEVLLRVFILGFCFVYDAGMGVRKRLAFNLGTPDL